jgi:hypothetical protein
MPSQIKVDEIKNVAGQYEIKTNTLKGQTTAGSIAVQGEGSATTNLQQGLAKSWAAGDNSSGSTVTDSLNVASLTDVATGKTTLTFTNNMRGAGAYTAGGTHADGSDQAAYAYITQALQDGSVATGSIALTHNYAYSNASGNGDYAYWNNTVHGDLA